MTIPPENPARLDGFSDFSATLAELTTSRLAHEIVGPVGAISNGLELMEELGADAGDDAVNLVTNSARQAGARLQFYRMAYGQSGYGITNLAHLRSAATALFDDMQYHDLAWPLPPVLPSLVEGMGRVILIMTELSRDCLVRGGTVRVSINDDAVDVVAEGEAPHMEAQLAQALSGDTSARDLTPRTVHAALASCFASAIGYNVGLKEGPDTVTLSLRRAIG